MAGFGAVPLAGAPSPQPARSACVHPARRQVTCIFHSLGFITSWNADRMRSGREGLRFPPCLFSLPCVLLPGEERSQAGQGERGCMVAVWPGGWESGSPQHLLAGRRWRNPTACNGTTRVRSALRCLAASRRGWVLEPMPSGFGDGQRCQTPWVLHVWDLKEPEPQATSSSAFLQAHGAAVGFLLVPALPACSSVQGTAISTLDEMHRVRAQRAR